MSEQDKSKQELIEELASLRQEVAQLRISKTVFDAQKHLLQTFVTMARTTTGAITLKAMLQDILKTSTKLTDAAESSLFLLNADGIVTESVLARGPLIREQKQNLIGKVLDQGLAGWVIRNRQIGLIADTMNDVRWLTFPNQPYTVRSVLCVPILRGKHLLGIVTLMHPEPQHFTSELADLMQMAVEQIALILDHLQCYIEGDRSELPRSLESIQIEPKPLSNSNLNSLSTIGIYILGQEKFFYANTRFADIFGYSLSELASLNSVFDIIASESRSFVTEQIEQCLGGKKKKIHFNFKGKTKSDQIIDVELDGTRLKFSGKSSVIGVIRANEPI